MYILSHVVCSTMDSNPWVYCSFISLRLSNKLILPTEIRMKWNEASPPLLKTIRFNSLNICLWGMFSSNSVFPLSRAMSSILSGLPMPDLDIIFLLQLQHHQMPSKSSISISSQNSLVYSVTHFSLESFVGSIMFTWLKNAYPCFKFTAEEFFSSPCM